MREIASGVNLKSPSSVCFHLQALEREGRILMESACSGDRVSRCRAIRLLEKGDSKLPCAPSLVPVLRDPTVARDTLFSEENIMAYTDFCRYTGDYHHGDFVVCLGVSNVRSHIPGLQKDDYILIRSTPVGGPPSPVLIQDGSGAYLAVPGETLSKPSGVCIGHAVCMQRNFRVPVPPLLRGDFICSDSE